MTERFAIYYAPGADTPLWRFGTGWLGRDPESGSEFDIADIPGLPAAERRTITASPRRYGFHATLKPPFRLADGTDAASLRDALAAFARRHVPFGGRALEVGALGGFLALTPSAAWPEMDAFAAACVEAFDGFRAPSDADERARRNRASLSPRQAEYVARWGYPYVLDEFRFHMTLTDRLADPVRERVHAVLAETAAPFLGKETRVDAIALYHEREPGAPFRLVDRFALAAGD